MENSIYFQHPALIAVFGFVVILMLFLDLGIFNKNSHEITNKEALKWSVIWIGLAMLFSFLVLILAGKEKFVEFQSAYWIEKSLSVDNLFVFILVFKFYQINNKHKHKVLFWGILSALFLRAIFIFSGSYLIEKAYINSFLLAFGLQPFTYNFNIILTLFGLFLVFAGIKSLKVAENDATDFSKNKGALFIRKIFKITDSYHGSKFFVKIKGQYWGTPLLLVLAVIEFTDVVFALDSIPAIFAISKDPFILYTSNIFAILGLRALFFLLNNFMFLFSKLSYGLAVILTFIGLKMMMAPIYHIPSLVSLGVILLTLLLSVVWSLSQGCKNV